MLLWYISVYLLLFKQLLLLLYHFYYSLHQLGQVSFLACCQSNSNGINNSLLIRGATHRVRSMTLLLVRYLSNNNPSSSTRPLDRTSEHPPDDHGGCHPVLVVECRSYDYRNVTASNLTSAPTTNSFPGLIVYTLGTGFSPIARSLVTFLVETHHVDDVERALQLTDLEPSVSVGAGRPVLGTADRHRRRR